MVASSLADNLMRLVAEGAGEGDDEADAELRSRAAASYLQLLNKPKLPNILLKVQLHFIAGHMHSLESIYILTQVHMLSITSDKCRCYRALSLVLITHLSHTCPNSKLCTMLVALAPGACSRPLVIAPGIYFKFASIKLCIHQLPSGQAFQQPQNHVNAVAHLNPTGSFEDDFTFLRL